MKTLGDRAAFPRTGSYNGDVRISSQEGMSLRAWLAGQALAGILSDYGRVLDEDTAAEIAIEVCWCADATLKELAKEGR